jgi:arsenate reductase
MKTVYGIKNCNTVKKVLTLLDNHNIAYTFHDYKKSGITEEQLKNWIQQVGWEVLVNKKGTTWRQLDDVTKASITNATNAVALMLEKTSVIKRPIIEEHKTILSIGWDENILSKL